MKHRFGYSKLNRDMAARKALLRGLSTQLIKYGRIETTVAKAKAVRSVVEKLVSMARQDTVAHRQLARARLYDRVAVKRLFAEIAPANATRPGGYTRVVHLGFRAGDHARRAIVEFVEPSLIGGETAESRPTEQAAGEQA